MPGPAAGSSATSLGPHATHRPDNGCESAIDRAILKKVADAPGTTANVAIVEQTIHHSGAMLSRLELPVIPAI